MPAHSALLVLDNLSGLLQNLRGAAQEACPLMDKRLPLVDSEESNTRRHLVYSRVSVVQPEVAQSSQGTHHGPGRLQPHLRGHRLLQRCP